MAEQAQLKKTLSDRGLRALKPAPKGKRYVVMDTEVPGFGVRVTERGTRTFILAARFPGSPHFTRREIGEFGALGLADARQRARQWREMIRQGIDPKDEAERQKAAETQRKATTFGAVADDWSQEKVSTERKGVEVEREFRQEFVSRWEKRPVTGITELDVLNVIREKKQSAPAQARNLLGHAKRFFSWAIDQRVYGLNVNPAENLKPSKIIGEKVAGSRTLSDDEIFALWRAARRLPYPHGAVYRLLLLSALRLNEAADAAWSELDPAVARVLRGRRDGEAIDWRQFKPEQLLWVIPAERMKGRSGKARPHAVPLTTDILGVLEEVPIFANGTFLFSTTRGKSPAWMSDKVKKRLDARMLRTLRALARRRGDDPAAVALPRWTNHDIRRTVRSQLSRLRIAEEAREAVLAHARPGIKGTYDHHDYLDEKREALELWAARLRSIVEPPPPNVVPLGAGWAAAS
jgi:integrase